MSQPAPPVSYRLDPIQRLANLPQHKLDEIGITADDIGRMQLLHTSRRVVPVPDPVLALQAERDKLWAAYQDVHAFLLWLEDQSDDGRWRWCRPLWRKVLDWIT